VLRDQPQSVSLHRTLARAYVAQGNNALAEESLRNAADFAPNDNNVDDNGHGTNVSGIVHSVAPSAQIVALDVFNGEPSLNPRYFDLPNVFMLPHIGSSTIETRRRMAAALIEQLRTWIGGGTPSSRLV